MYKDISELKANCLNCKNCPLCETRKNVVFGEGNIQADIMFIGEAPGENEDLTGRPFVGRGGKLLDEMLATVDLNREKNIYIANSIKCRPPKNRDPSKTEQEACKFWLENQIKLINPKIIICVGRISAVKLIRKDFKIMKEHGQFFEKDNRLYMATLHPAAILRNPNNKSVALNDYVILKEKFSSLINPVC